MSVLKVSNAFKEYKSASDSTTVLRKFNMNVAPKTIYSLVGPSGCGKTTIISSLVGSISLDSGTIEVFGELPKINRTRVGFMPQENSLVKEFTVREMVWFFGKVFGLSSKKINERFKFLSELLELPDGDTLIRDCSGGQQRRVSFAVTLVHEPELLILDEPTVGLDPLLRIKIWDYLLEITSNQQATVLLSTHYIEEAKMSTHIGLMRNGILIAQETPQNILIVTHCQRLDEAFLKLSEGQGTENDILIQETTTSSSESKDEEENIITQSSFQILTALVAKNFLQLYRNIDISLWAILLPLIGVFLCLCTLNPVADIPFGFVNQEVQLPEDCSNSSVRLEGLDCLMPKLSCKVIDAISTQTFIKKYFLNIDEAFEAAKKGKIFGFVHFSENFTNMTPLLLNDDDFEETDPENVGLIKFYRDNTDFIKSYYAETEIRRAYKKAFEEEFMKCGFPQKVVEVPLLFEGFDEKAADLTPTFASAMMLSFFFTSAINILVNSINYDRHEGIWNRSLVAGVRPSHFLIAHLIEGLSLMLCQLAIFATYMFFLMRNPLTLKAVVLIIVLLFLVGTAGLCYGLFCSTVMENPQSSIYASQLFLFPVFAISGVVWPLNGSPIFLQHAARAGPAALPVSAMRNILEKTVNFTDPSYYNALLVLSAWITVSLASCFWKLRDSH